MPLRDTDRYLGDRARGRRADCRHYDVDGRPRAICGKERNIRFGGRAPVRSCVGASGNGMASEGSQGARQFSCVSLWRPARPSMERSLPSASSARRSSVPESSTPRTEHLHICTSAHRPLEACDDRLIRSFPSAGIDRGGTLQEASFSPPRATSAREWRTDSRQSGNWRGRGSNIDFAMF